MKKIFALCLVLPFLMLSFNSCSSSDDDDWQEEESLIVGKWVLKELGIFINGEGGITPYDNGCPGQDVRAEFYANGTFYTVAHEIEEDCVAVEEQGVYWIDNDNLVLKIDPDTEDEEIVTERIKSLTATRLTLVASEIFDGELMEIHTIFHKQ